MHVCIFGPCLLHPQHLLHLCARLPQAWAAQLPQNQAQAAAQLVSDLLTGMQTAGKSSQNSADTQLLVVLCNLDLLEAATRDLFFTQHAATQVLSQTTRDCMLQVQLLQFN
jgi:hypothetical protein